jgi:hypothetical protein
MEKNLPYIQVKDLPSKGLAYPENYNITYRPFTYGEVKQYSTSNISLQDRVKQLMEGINANFDKYSITLMDFLFIILLRRISTLGSTNLKLTYFCNGCREENTETIKLNNIEFKDLEVKKLPLVLKINEDERYEFTPLTVGDYIQLLDMKKDNDDIAVMAKQMRNMKYEDAYRVIANEYRPDVIEIYSEIDKKLNHGVKPVKFKCKKCQFENEVNLDTGGDSFLLDKFRSPQRPNSLRIVLDEGA